jgi:hypothetical protein
MDCLLAAFMKREEQLLLILQQTEANVELALIAFFARTELTFIGTTTYRLKTDSSLREPALTSIRTGRFERQNEGHNECVREQLELGPENT